MTYVYEPEATAPDAALTFLELAATSPEGTAFMPTRGDLQETAQQQRPSIFLDLVLIESTVWSHKLQDKTTKNRFAVAINVQAQTWQGVSSGQGLLKRGWLSV
jgi:hypothetical protein